MLYICYVRRSGWAKAPPWLAAAWDTAGHASLPCGRPGSLAEPWHGADGIWRSEGSSADGARAFPITAWSTVSQARRGHSDHSRAALAASCQACWSTTGLPARSTSAPRRWCRSCGTTGRAWSAPRSFKSWPSTCGRRRGCAARELGLFNEPENHEEAALQSATCQAPPAALALQSSAPRRASWYSRSCSGARATEQFAARTPQVAPSPKGL